MYKHLTQEQRYYIELNLSNNVPITKISKSIKVHVSTIYREIKRNKMKNGAYHYKAAQGKSEVRRHEASSSNCFKQLTIKAKDYIITKLKASWSPEQIAGRMVKDLKLKISYKTIYKYLSFDKEQGGKLYKLLAHQGKKYKYGKTGGSRILNRVDISQRPKIVELKKRVGDWEADTIVGKMGGSKHCLLTLVDRKTKFTLIRKLNDKTAMSVQEAIEDLYSDSTMPFITITPDNGTEFTNHQQISTNIGCNCYFARP